MPKFIVKPIGDVVVGEPTYGHWADEGGGLKGKQSWVDSPTGVDWLKDRKATPWPVNPKPDILYVIVDVEDEWHRAQHDRAIVKAHDDEVERREKHIAQLRSEPILKWHGAVTIAGVTYTADEVREARLRVFARLAVTDAKRNVLPAQPNCLDDHEERYFEDAD